MDCRASLAMTENHRHCEERSDAAIAMTEMPFTNFN